MTDKPENFVGLDPFEIVSDPRYNVREDHTDEDVDDMAESILQNGIIHSPNVAKIDGKWTVIAGLRRVLGARKAGVKPITCLDRTGASEADLIEISLAENVKRRDLKDLTLYQAFTKLRIAGREIPDIMRTFDMTEKQVRQRLAIGGLPKRVLGMAEAGKLPDGALRELTAIPRGKAEQYARMKPARRPHWWNIKSWARGKKGWISYSNALFPVSHYQGVTEEDLFTGEDETRYFSDVDAFWALQDGAIEEKVQSYEKRGWEVEHVDVWDPANYEKRAKSKGGKVLYHVDRDSGAVQFLEGRVVVIRPRTSTRKGKSTVKKPELTNAYTHYLRELRHAAVQDALIDDPAAALAVNIAAMLSNANNWRLDDPDHLRCQKVRNKKQQASIDQNPNRVAVVAAFKSMHDQLGIKPESRQASKYVARLIEYPVADLVYFLSVTTAYMLGSGYNNRLANAAAKEMGVEAVDFVADDAFWAGIQSRDALIAILEELGQKPDPNKGTNASLRKAARAAAGPNWVPKWLRFPGRYYGKPPSNDRLLSNEY